METFGDQLWAEAAHYAATRVRGDWRELVLRGTALRAEAQERVDEAALMEAWDDDVVAFAEATGAEGIKSSVLLSRAGIPIPQQQPRHLQRLSALLRARGFVLVQRRWEKGGSAERRWLRRELA